MKKAIVVARVSDPKQESNQAQIVRVSNYAEQKGFFIWKKYEIEESSTKGDRKKFQQIIKDIEDSKELIVLVVDTVDRLQRSFRESVIFDDLRKAGKVEIHFYRENLIVHQHSNSADLLRWDMAVIFARSYVLQLSDNVKRRFEQKRRDGELTHKAPIGYKSIMLDVQKRLRKDIVVDPDRGHLITKLFELYATGNYSITTLWHKITDMGLRNTNDQKLVRSHIDNILKETFYYGIARSVYGPYPHNYPRLTTKELFDACQQVRKGRKKKPSKESDTKPYIFRGLLTCQHCRCLMTPEIKKGKHIYYSCTNAKGNCKRVYIPESILLRPVYEVFEAFNRIPREVQEELVNELRKSNEYEVEFHQKEIARIQSEYNRTQNKIERLTDILLDGSITKDEYDKKLQQLKDQQYQLGIELEEYTKADHEYHLHVSTVLNLSRKMKEIFDSSEILEKRAILNYLLQNPTVSGKNLHYTLRKPFDVLLELAHRPNWLPSQDSNLEPSRYM